MSGGQIHFTMKNSIKLQMSTTIERYNQAATTYMESQTKIKENFFAFMSN